MSGALNDRNRRTVLARDAVASRRATPGAVAAASSASVQGGGTVIDVAGTFSVGLAVGLTAAGWAAANPAAADPAKVHGVVVASANGRSVILLVGLVGRYGTRGAAIYAATGGAVSETSPALPDSESPTAPWEIQLGWQVTDDAALIQPQPPRRPRTTALCLDGTNTLPLTIAEVLPLPPTP